MISVPNKKYNLSLKKKKGLHFESISDFLIFVHKKELILIFFFLKTKDLHFESVWDFNLKVKHSKFTQNHKESTCWSFLFYMNSSSFEPNVYFRMAISVSNKILKLE